MLADEFPQTTGLTDLIEQLSGIRTELLQAATEWEPWITERSADRDASARNLLQYLVLRSHDLRELQLPLIALGLSSLGRSEGHVQATLDAVLAAIREISKSPPQPPPDPAPIGFAHSRELLAARAESLLGAAPCRRPTRIMVTMPSDAAGDVALVRDMLQAGMDCVRINTAHDGPDMWRSMLANLRVAEQQSGRRARVLVDLPGPKLRTGRFATAPLEDAKGPFVRLSRGDRVILTRETGAHGGVAEAAQPPRIACSLSEAFAVTRPGHHIWIDDGKFGTIVESVTPDSIALRVVSAAPKGSKLRPEKGINLPDAELDLDILNSHGEAALRFATEAADIVGVSFVCHPHQVSQVSGYLDLHTSPQVGMVLKIETRRAFDQLPGMLLAALGSGRPAGAMIARGDLAVECGYERLAEVQEEILWLCQAAHIPVIWATEVLDRLAKKGRPSRAEITDAAMGIQAECVMLNKGPRIVEAICVLDDILRRMERHQRKKRPLLPRLAASQYVATH